jgi:hypothetical protein
MPNRQRSQRVEAIVLRHSDWGEADRMLGLFTRELGKVRAVAKGARKARSRKAGHLEPFTRVSLLLARGRDAWIVTQAEAVEPHLALREDLVRVGYAAYVVELLDRFTYEEGENVALYRLLTETLQRLDTEPAAAFCVRWRRDPGRGPVLFSRAGRGNLPALRSWDAGVSQCECGGVAHFAPFATLQLYRGAPPATLNYNGP